MLILNKWLCLCSPLFITHFLFRRRESFSVNSLRQKPNEIKHSWDGHLVLLLEQWELFFLLSKSPPITPTSLFHSVVFSKDRVAKLARWGFPKEKADFQYGKEMSNKGKERKGHESFKISRVKQHCFFRTDTNNVSEANEQRIFIFSYTKFDVLVYRIKNRFFIVFYTGANTQ